MEGLLPLFLRVIRRRSQQPQDIDVMYSSVPCNSGRFGSSSSSSSAPITPRAMVVTGTAPVDVHHRSSSSSSSFSAASHTSPSSATTTTTTAVGPLAHTFSAVQPPSAVLTSPMIPPTAHHLLKLIKNQFYRTDSFSTVASLSLTLARAFSLSLFPPPWHPSFEEQFICAPS